jgi:hypothetical protein
MSIAVADWTRKKETEVGEVNVRHLFPSWWLSAESPLAGRNNPPGPVSHRTGVNRNKPLP